MPPWLLNIPTITGTACIAAFLYFLFSGKIALGREVLKERERAEEFKKLLLDSQASMKDLQKSIELAVIAIEKISRKKAPTDDGH